MASKLAILLAAPSADEDDNPKDDAVAWCDHELQGVREVLEGLRWQTEEAEPCWCRVRVNGLHDEFCQRARDLHSRLEIR
jgi:hypothetical protein